MKILTILTIFYLFYPFNPQKNDLKTWRAFYFPKQGTFFMTLTFVQGVSALDKFDNNILIKILKTSHTYFKSIKY